MQSRRIDGLGVLLMDRAARYALERAIWVKAGKPYRSESEINAIFTDICEPCESFQRKSDIRGICALCGCRLRNKGKYLNKIAWGTTKCPDGKW